MHRKDIALLNLDKNGKGLEIGPCHNPIAPKTDGYNVDIIDHASKQELIEKYRTHSVDLERIEEVDFIWNGESYEELTGYKNHYDWVIASHVIEHSPDLIGFLQNCENVLTESGALSLIIPDARYCFDHFRPLSGLGSVIDSHVQKLNSHSQGKITEYFLNVVSKQDAISWRAKNDFGYKMIHDLAYTKDRIQEALQGQYLDIHAWCFTPTSFRLIIHDLNQLGYINLSEQSFHETVGTEFFITLSPNGQCLRGDRLDYLKDIHKELAEVLPRNKPPQQIVPSRRPLHRRLISKLLSVLRLRS